MAEETTPTPDPTILTTEQLERAITGLKELMASELKGQEQICTEKFESVNKQFVLVERQRVEQKADTEKAVQAALNAAKEAVKEQTAASDRAITKSETAFTTAIKSVEDKVDDVKDRVGKIESLKQGGKDTLYGIYLIVGLIVLLLVIGAALAAAGAFGP